MNAYADARTDDRTDAPAAGARPLPLRVFAAAMRRIPLEHRFRAVAATLPLLLVIRDVRSAVLRRGRRASQPWQSSRDLLLRDLLASLDDAGVRYTLPMIVDGGDALEHARRAGHGVLIVSAHGGMAQALLIHFQRLNVPIAAVARGPLRVPGTGVAHQPGIAHGSYFMIRVRGMLRRGLVVSAAIDRFDEGTSRDEPRSVPVETRHGTAHITTSLVELAHRCGSPIVYWWAGIGPDGVLRGTFGAPSASARGNTEATIREFAGFLCALKP